MGNILPRREHNDINGSTPADETNLDKPLVREPPQKRRKLNNTTPQDAQFLNSHSTQHVKNEKKPETPITDQDQIIPIQLNKPNEKVVKRKKRKVALFFGYLGEKYSGMQLNPGVVTIEEVVFKALCQAGAISGPHTESQTKVNWMRAARTDKGVSAAAQCVSAKLECEVDKKIDPDLIIAINRYLPNDIELYGMLRATGGFNARGNCHRRRYEYIFPIRLLGGVNGTEKETEPGQGDPRIAKFNSILSQYEGTHCFSNFTEGLESTDDASKRYMIRVRCGQPFLPPNSGVYYVAVEIYGQSFLLHQIRKMVGLAALTYLGHVPIETIRVALCPYVKLPTPMAPALGLLLDNLTFDTYNKRFEKVLEKMIAIEEFQEAKEKFKHTRIYKRIAEKERLDRVLETWFKTSHHKCKYERDHILNLHSKFILTDAGKEEQRKAHLQSLYQIRTSMKEFLDSEDSTMLQSADYVFRQFEERYGRKPTFMARAPGKVILIGEHLDYNGLPVITAGLTQGTFITGCFDDTEYIDVDHVESETYAAGRLRATGHRMALTDGEEKSDLDSKWLQYICAGVKSLVQNIPGNQKHIKGGGRLMVGGDLPKAAGLGSSSSLVVSAALAAARLNRKRLPRQDMAKWCAQGERTELRTNGGPVDHVTSLCAAKNSALRISFTPNLSIQNMELPSGATFIAVHSGVKAQKGINDFFRNEFNLRGAECRVGAAILARRLDVYGSKSVTTPGQLLFHAKKTGKLQCKDVSKLLTIVRKVMGENEILTMKEIEQEIGVTEIELRNRFLQGVDAGYFKVGKRMNHVFSEAVRVECFEQVLNNESMNDKEKVYELGSILNEGQKSLQTYFETSCDEVDELINFCQRNGAIGSRMTGAGWGGFTLHLVLNSQIATFLNTVIERVGDDAIVEISPSSGACIYAIHSPVGPRIVPDGDKTKNVKK